MKNAHSNIAIITARGGSKRIHRKNVRLFRGKPMVAWSIEAALQSKLFDTVMVSTDDLEIAEIAKTLGADVPFMRSQATSDDYSTTADVLKEVLAMYATRDASFLNACCIYATAAFTTSTDLIEGFRALESQKFDVVIPIAAFSYPIWRSLQRNNEGGITFNFPEHRSSRSQDLPPVFHDAGQWYWFRTPAFLKQGTLLGENTGSVLLSELKVQDIDTEDDWQLAEIKHQRLFDDAGSQGKISEFL